jgi:ubiquinone/menaquinone biosynthesis C-methylase UbiE
MLRRARTRLGPVVALADGLRTPLGPASIAHAVSVWVVQAVADPVWLFREAARVLRPDGRYVVCATQRPAPDDTIGQIMAAMAARVDARRRAARPRGVSADQVLTWSTAAGFTGRVHQLQREWRGTPADEITAIQHRTWPAMRQLDDATIAEVIGPAIDALRALGPGERVRRATADMVVLVRE